MLAMIILQPERVLLQRQVARFAAELRGELLDVGSGRSNRYGPLCVNASSRRTLDTDPRGKPDILASAEDIPLPDGSVDSVLCTQVLEHVQHPHDVAAELFRVLKPGGLLLLTVPQLNELHEEPHDYFRYTRYGLEALLKDAGFRIEDIDQRGGYHCCRAQLRIRRWLDRYKPYDHRLANLLLWPVCTLLTHYAIWRDAHDSSPSNRVHALGWCVLARKPKA